MFERIYVAEAGKQTKQAQTNHNKQADKKTCRILGVSTNSVQAQGRAILVGVHTTWIK